MRNKDILPYRERVIGGAEGRVLEIGIGSGLNLPFYRAMVPNDAVMVKVQDGRVTLSGQVQWNYQRIASESAVRRLSGVVGVHNDIEMKPRVQPQDIKRKIMEALKRNAELEANAIRVNVSGDKVTLEGKVKSWYEHGVAERAAWSAPGVKAVEDRLLTA